MTAWRERGVTVRVPSESFELEGIWQGGSNAGGVIAPPHPEYGGSLDNPVVNELAFGLHKAGIPSLRFNWRGVGASQGAVTGQTDAALADYRAALEHLADTVDPGSALVACGYSFGAATALRAAVGEARIQRVIVVAPPVAMLGDLAPETLRVPVHVISGGQDAHAPADALRDWVSAMPDGQLELLPGVDHFFMSGGLAEVSAFAAAAVGA